MNEINIAENTENSGSNGSVFVPSLQLTKGQPEPIAANGGLSYYSFDNAGDAGTGRHYKPPSTTLKPERAEVIKLIEKGPAQSRQNGASVFGATTSAWLISRNKALTPPKAGWLCRTVYHLRRPTYSVVPSNAIWHDPAPNDANRLREAEEQNRHLNLYFPQIMRDARQLRNIIPAFRQITECMDKLGVSRISRSKCANFYDSAEVERVFYPEIEKLLLDFFPGTGRWSTITTFSTRTTKAIVLKIKMRRTLASMHVTPIWCTTTNDNSGRVRCRELLTKNLRNFGRQQNYTVAEAEAKMSLRFMSINLAKPMETVEQFPTVLCAWRRSQIRNISRITGFMTIGSVRQHVLPIVPGSRMVLVPAANTDRGFNAEVL